MTEYSQIIESLASMKLENRRIFRILCVYEQSMCKKGSFSFVSLDFNCNQNSCKVIQLIRSTNLNYKTNRN